MQVPKGQTDFSPGSKISTNTKLDKKTYVYMLAVSLLITADEQNNKPSCRQ